MITDNYDFKIYVKAEDARAWASTLNFYAEASKKALDEVVVTKTREVLFYLAKRVKEDVGLLPKNMRGYRLADGSKDSLKLVAWLLKKRALTGKIPGWGEEVPSGKYKGKRMARITREYTNKKGERRATVELLGRAKYYKRSYAQKFARKQSNTRWGHRQFIYVLPFRAAQTLVSKASAAGLPTKGRSPQSPTAKKKLANVSTYMGLRKDKDLTTFTLSAAYYFLKTQTLAEQPTIKSAGHLQNIYNRNLAKAFKDSITNMAQYISRKVAKQWSRHNSRTEGIFGMNISGTNSK